MPGHDCLSMLEICDLAESRGSGTASKGPAIEKWNLPSPKVVGGWSAVKRLLILVDYLHMKAHDVMPDSCCLKVLHL